MAQLSNEKKISVAIGCDPNAAALKEIIKTQLKEMGYEVSDFGSDDPIYARVAFARDDFLEYSLPGFNLCADIVEGFAVDLDV